MHRQEKERLRRYGQLVCDFANAKTTDDAYLGVIEKMEAMSGLSRKSAEMVKQQFPLFSQTPSEFFESKSISGESLSELEKKLWNLCTEESKAFDSLRRQLTKYRYHIESYDRKNTTLVVTQYDDEYSEDSKIPTLIIRASNT